ncbi:MAG: hypothetical protein ACLFSM_02565 [Thermoplasmata archaeon]
MENLWIKTFINDLLSKRINKFTLLTIILSGVILCLIASLTGLFPGDLIMALGISITVGAVIGGYTGLKVGWPLGRWIGLVGGLTVPPFLGFLLRNAATAYYASIIGPILGITIGIWSEREEKKEINEIIEKIRA